MELNGLTQFTHGAELIRIDMDNVHLVTGHSVYKCGQDPCASIWIGVNADQSCCQLRLRTAPRPRSLNAQDAFWPIPDLISCAGVTGGVGVTCHAHATQNMHHNVFSLGMQ